MTGPDKTTTKAMRVIQNREKEKERDRNRKRVKNDEEKRKKEAALNEIEVNDMFARTAYHDFLCFTRGLIIPSATGPQRFVTCMAGFQKETFAALAPSLLAVRDGTLPPIRRYWIERTKKAGKDSDLAIIIIWLMAFPKRPTKCQICASNSKQARIIEDRAVEILFHNPWLSDYIEIVQSVIRSKKMPREVWTRIEATGTAGQAQGQTPDLLILNELVHVDRWDVMQAHMNNAAGVRQGIVIISTNAGIRGSPAEVWRSEATSKESRWSSHIWSNLAPWISEEDIEEARRQDPVGAEFARLWQGRWISGIGNAVDEAALNKAFRLKGPTLEKESGWTYLAGLDLGVSHDHSGLVILGINRTEQRMKVALIKAWEPSIPTEGGKLEVDLDLVERECNRLSQLYGIVWFGFDPAAGGSFMAQRLRKQGIMMQEVVFSVGNLTRMATSFVQVMKDGILECYEDNEGRLRRDFGKFNIEHRPPSNYRLTAISDRFGHADVGTALVICLPQAMSRLEGWGSELREIYIDDDKELTEGEIEELPEEFQELMAMKDDADNDIVGYGT